MKNFFPSSPHSCLQELRKQSATTNKEKNREPERKKALLIQGQMKHE